MKRKIRKIPLNACHKFHSWLKCLAALFLNHPQHFTANPVNYVQLFFFLLLAKKHVSYISVVRVNNWFSVNWLKRTYFPIWESRRPECIENGHTRAIDLIKFHFVCSVPFHRRRIDTISSKLLAINFINFLVWIVNFNSDIGNHRRNWVHLSIKYLYIIIDCQIKTSTTIIENASISISMYVLRIVWLLVPHQPMSVSTSVRKEKKNTNIYKHLMERKHLALTKT